MTSGLGLAIELMVAILLVLTIGYCMMLNRRLKVLKADEQAMRATIAELVTATEIAERAIGGLKQTVKECEGGLGERLRSADRFTAELDRSIAAGKELFERLAQMVIAGGGTLPATPPAPSRQDGNEEPRGAQAVAVAAQAFAERVRMKVHGIAA